MPEKVLTPQQCDEVIDMLSVGQTVERAAVLMEVSTGSIDLITNGNYRSTQGVYKPKVDMKKAGLQQKCDGDEIDEICARYEYGDIVEQIAKDFCITPNTVKSYAKRRGVKRNKARWANMQDKDTAVYRFLHDVRAILWRDEPSKDRRTYRSWENKVEELRSTGKYNIREAEVTASLQYPCCAHLFELYDVSEYLPDQRKEEVESAQAPFEVEGETPVKSKGADKMRSEGKEQSYRENLNWAIQAAGKERRTGVPPESCPNDAAYWLYLQAKGEPKEFLSKVSAMESRINANDEEKQHRKSEQRSIDDLELMISGLTE